MVQVETKIYSTSNFSHSLNIILLTIDIAIKKIPKTMYEKVLQAIFFVLF